jgi:hypothetical protein
MRRLVVEQRFSRRWLVGALLAVIGMAAAGVFVRSGVAGAEANDPVDEGASIVEDYSYPGAAAIEQSRHITLLKGDGHVLLVDCATAPDPVRVQSFVDGTRPGDDFCFQINGPSGYLTMRLADSYFIKGDSVHRLKALVTPNDTTPPSTVNVPADNTKWIPLTYQTTTDPQILVEIRTDS